MWTLTHPKNRPCGYAVDMLRTTSHETLLRKRRGLRCAPQSRPFQFSRRSTKNISRSAGATRPLNIFGILPARWRVMQASIVAAAVPTTPGAPCAPGHIIVLLAEGISRFPGRAIGAPGVIARVNDHVLRHCGSCQHGRKHCGSANQAEFRHATLLLVRVTQMTKRGCERRFRFLKDNCFSRGPLARHARADPSRPSTARRSRTHQRPFLSCGG
jgi:hypothetical protein